MPAKKKLLTQKEIPSYQLAVQCIGCIDRHGKLRKISPLQRMALAKEVAATIRAYRAEERRVN